MVQPMDLEHSLEDTKKWWLQLLVSYKDLGFWV